jgi:uncharacterized protein YfaS (alpha-2-macroglobulin family)
MFLRSVILLAIISLLLFIPAMAQKNDPYADSWKKVEEFINKGLPKSANEEVDKIYSRAKQENNQPQFIKALVYKSQLVQQVEEDDWFKNVTSFEKEATAAKEPGRQILHSILAQLYWNYFQNQRWKIYSRTNTIGFQKDDPETWSPMDFHQVIKKHFDASLSNPGILQQTKLDNYEPVLNKGNQRRLRPTLYDLLVNEALDYYKTNEENITQPANTFILNDQASLAPAKIYVRQEYKSADSLSHEYQAIQLYQDWIRFHLLGTSKEDIAQLVDADIARIRYAYANQVNEGKEQLYKEALEQIYTQYKQFPEAMQAGYWLAMWWKNKGDRYVTNVGTQTDKFALKQALQLAEEVSKAFPESEGGINAYNLALELKKPSLTTSAEKVNVIQSPFRALISYKNISNVHLRLIAIDDDENYFDGRSEYVYNDKNWQRLAAAKPVRAWQQALPVFDDLREHSTEIKVEAVSVGKYILLSSANAGFSIDKNPLAASVFYVSNISFVNNASEYFILHRESGQPLAGASVQVYTTGYDYNSRKSIDSKAELLKADKNGYINISEKNSSRNLRLDIRYNNDRLFLKDEQYNFRTHYGEQPKKAIADWDIARYYIFMDRAIYRPGQKVYFKAIGVLPRVKGSNAKGNSLFVPDHPITVQLKDANYQTIDSLKLTPNEFGSIHGSFVLPETGLTGSFQLYIDIPQGAAAEFKVEEYKRPKFFVEADTLSGSYTINDSITVTGAAKAYAGNNIDGATVKYRVHRQTRFLYPWLLWSRKIIWPPYGRDNDQEITSGETTTDAAGKYRIVFKAIPDLGVDKALDPSFDYTIDVDITDINGETRSSSQTVSIGYKSMQVTITVPGGEQQDVESLKAINISTTNLAGKHVPAQVAVKIWSLKTPSRLIRERYWQQPDTSVMTEAEYVKYFPHDEYANESDPHAWAKDKLQMEQQVQTTEPSTKVLLDSKKWQPGWYVIEATTIDKDGQEIKSMAWVALNDYDKNLAASPNYNFTKAIKETVEPGEEALFIQGTNAPKVFAIQQVTKQTGVDSKTESQFDFKTINQTFTTLRFPAKEEDRGGYTVNLFFIKDNRIYSNSWMVNVPWTNKQLNISFETFRDKLLPGQEETWKVKISGSKGDAVAAEMLASMYDASLDQFETHNWGGLQIWNRNRVSGNWNAANNFTTGVASNHSPSEKTKSFAKSYDQLIGVGVGYRGRIMLSGKVAGVQSMEMKMAAPSIAQDMSAGEVAENAGFVAIGNNGMIVADSVASIKANAEENKEDHNIQIRTNFNETAFFFPDLHTNDKGEISFSFTIPEALTQWKLQTLAHTKDLSTAFATRSIQTQKKLMVQPNAPRFFRQGDSLTMQVKIVNMSSEDLQGQAQLHLLNSNTMANVDALFANKTTSIPFSVKAGQSVAVAFPISIPMNYTDAVSYRITATAGDASDGEEMAIPVLTNRMLVTESFPINLRNTNSKTFTWNKLLQSGSSSSLQNKSLTVEYSSNPVWYAVQALPYLMEYPYDCAEQTWNRYYANALASKIAKSMPKIKAVFDQWKNSTDTTALLSNLQKNQELKAVLLEETPWVLEAKSEAAQKKNIALLFDMVKMSNEGSKALNKLSELQSSNGGFSWFKGGPDDRYMTQYILSGIGHLQKLEAMPAAQSEKLNSIIARAIPYLDKRLKEDYDELVKQKADLSKNHLTSTAAQYLYMRSFFSRQAFEGNTTKAYEYYKSQAKNFWTSQAKYEQGMIALALFRTNEQTTASAILKSLVENSISNEEFGMYWKEFNTGGYYWWQAPIESHALLIEAFSEIEKNNTRVNDLKTWLLKQKQTNNWRNTKATAEACYALLLQGSNWLNNEQTVSIKLGDTNIQPDKTEAGTGYFKETIAGEHVKPAMGNISVKLQPSTNQPANQSTSWGAVYWQYFEDLDKITTAATPLSLKKQLFIVRNSDRGPVLTPINDKDEVQVGDRIKVRVELRSDRNLEYVHLKDMRGSCFEPVNVLSQYKYQGGLGYYEATKDASTNFFISHLNRGTYVFEYEMLATHSGEFSNGISSIQCMYAPEFSSHSEGIRVKVK